MVNALADSNVWLRYSQLTDPQYLAARRAVETMTQRGDTLYLVPQTVSEYWRVATGTVRGGFGWTPAQADASVTRLEARFPLLTDTPAVYEYWRRIVLDYSVSGGQMYDARLVAAMQAHEITHLLTFNTKDFVRYLPLGIIVQHPQDL